MTPINIRLPLMAASLLGALGAVGTLGAQSVEGSVNLLRGCTNPGPQDSLVSSPLGEKIFVADEATTLIAFEFEDIVIGPGWRFENDANRAGFSGAGYFRWVAGNQFGNPGGGTMTYKIFVREPGTYVFKLHNRHDAPVGQENDVWMRVNAPVSPWFKAFSGGDASNTFVWNWSTIKGNGGPVRANFTAGVHEVQFSGRSTGFMIDRVHAWKEDTGFAGEDINLPLSDYLRSRPVAGGTWEFDIDDPQNEAGLTTGGQTVAGLLANLVPSPNLPCGTVLPVFGTTPGAGGEPFTALSPVPFTLLPPQTWQGPGQPAHFQLPIPADPAIVGLQMWVQSFLFDGAQARAVLGDGAELTVGDF
jgi:hypothetical protein